MDLHKACKKWSEPTLSAAYECSTTGTKIQQSSSNHERVIDILENSFGSSTTLPRTIQTPMLCKRGILSTREDLPHGTPWHLLAASWGLGSASWRLWEEHARTHTSCRFVCAFWPVCVLRSAVPSGLRSAFRPAFCVPACVLRSVRSGCVLKACVLGERAF